MFYFSIVALDINTMRLESRISDAHPNLISAVAANRFHRGEAAKTIATAAQDGTVQLWDLRTSGKQNREYNHLLLCLEPLHFLCFVKESLILIYRMVWRNQTLWAF